MKFFILGLCLAFLNSQITAADPLTAPLKAQFKFVPAKTTNFKTATVVYPITGSTPLTAVGGLPADGSWQFPRSLVSTQVAARPTGPQTGPQIVPPNGTTPSAAQNPLAMIQQALGSMAGPGGGASPGSFNSGDNSAYSPPRRAAPYEDRTPASPPPAQEPSRQLASLASKPADAIPAAAPSVTKPATDLSASELSKKFSCTAPGKPTASIDEVNQLMSQVLGYKDPLKKAFVKPGTSYGTVTVTLESQSGSLQLNAVSKTFPSLPMNAPGKMCLLPGSPARLKILVDTAEASAALQGMASGQKQMEFILTRVDDTHIKIVDGQQKLLKDTDAPLNVQSRTSQ